MYSYLASKVRYISHQCIGATASGLWALRFFQAHEHLGGCIAEVHILACNGCLGLVEEFLAVARCGLHAFCHQAAEE